MIFRSFLAVFLLAILLSGVGYAQREGNPANWCRGGGFAFDSEDFRIATVIGKKASRVHFYDDSSDDCPGNERCKSKAYVVPGDQVVIARTYKGYACSWFTPAKGFPTVGWIKIGDIKFLTPRPDPPLTAWLGEWTYGENIIRFTHNKLAGYLNVTGEAFWRGLGDNIHVGDLDDRAEPKGNLLKVGERENDEYACKATIRLIGDFLVVRDNMNCGGVNVTFSGVYRKRRSR